MGSVCHSINGDIMDISIERVFSLEFTEQEMQLFCEFVEAGSKEGIKLFLEHGGWNMEDDLAYYKKQYVDDIYNLLSKIYDVTGREMS
jgi:hypothetical protein